MLITFQRSNTVFITKSMNKNLNFKIFYVELIFVETRTGIVL